MKHWKKARANKACRTKEREHMEEDMKEKAKLEDIIGQGVEAKPYLGIKSLSQVRELFRIRASMVKGIKR